MLLIRLTASCLFVFMVMFDSSAQGFVVKPFPACIVRRHSPPRTTTIPTTYLHNNKKNTPMPTPSFDTNDDDNNINDSDSLLYDDFGDSIIGDKGSTTPDKLQQLIRQVKEEDVRREAQLAKNWKFGNWKVRGFSLDKYSNDNENEPTKDDGGGKDKIVHVSKVHPSLTPNQVIVGRTDGTVCVVTLGTQYLTQFVRKLTAKETSNATIQIQTELVPSGDRLTQDANDQTTPFLVEYQFSAHDTPIVVLATAETEDQSLLFTAAQDSGDIRVWSLPEESNDTITPLHTLSGARADTIVALAILSLSPDDEDDRLLLSASKDGSLALFDVSTGDLVFKCQMVQDDGEPYAILCADVDQSRSIIYLGMESGHVAAFCAQDVLKCASEGEIRCPVPNGRFMAHEGGVTAINCAGEGTMARSRPGASSSVLLTGGADGAVKQWEIMSRKSKPTSSGEPSFKLEHWPRLPTQRMQRRAHLFQGHHNELPITALVSIDASKFLSAGADGTIRAWSPSTGKELFRMDGFTDAISSLCLQDDLYLITDGMEHYVCVHDFDVQATEVEDGYELDW